jgi:hypothetical protein
MRRKNPTRRHYFNGYLMGDIFVVCGFVRGDAIQQPNPVMLVNDTGSCRVFNYNFNRRCVAGVSDGD